MITRNLLKRVIKVAAGALIGALAGFLYYKFIGCNGGTCPITSNPLNSTLYGSAIGALIGLI